MFPPDTQIVHEGKNTIEVVLGSSEDRVSGYIMPLCLLSGDVSHGHLDKGVLPGFSPVRLLFSPFNQQISWWRRGLCADILFPSGVCPLILTSREVSYLRSRYSCVGDFHKDTFEKMCRHFNACEDSHLVTTPLLSLPL